ncbi:hypothetical protein GDO86_017223 [Hymenochirus boettgeri]|uniref:Globin domain-containing protein n=1 Tax=Hymenochirus boettgeri TaxID=247094 RepID=A0A8T2IM76_9PIPI|nr:hypothetical protein GDO86_017223 [Hymenochirus boettgeri]
MVHWTATERQHINSLWGKVNAKTVGAEALGRLLSVYPWTQRYFASFGNLSSADSIAHNAQVASHGEKVLTSLGEAIKHMDDIKGYYSQLSKYHSDNLHVDPANFGRFGGVLIVVLARCFPDDFSPETQAAFEKLFGVIADALGKGYY